MEILVIGGSRFVGPYLLSELSKNGHKITALNRGNHTIEYPENVEHIKLDRSEISTLQTKFDAVVDMCAYVGEDTQTVLNGVEMKYFLNFGSVAAYQKTELYPLREDSKIGTWEIWGGYNKGKVETEEILKREQRKIGNIRPVYILGERNYVDRENFIYQRLHKGEEILLPGNGQALIQFIFAAEVANMIVKMVEEQIVGDFNIAGDEVVTLKGFVELLASIVGKEPILGYNNSADGINHIEAEFPFANEHVFCSNARMKKIGMEPKKLKVNLEEDFKNYYSQLL